LTNFIGKICEPRKMQRQKKKTSLSTCEF
ncbi:hypothetical protein XB85_16825, partial [Acinetobacter baumannii]|nr:hypothetical protein [Acinetobacter baumannii]